MNAAQRTILQVALAAVIVTMLFPPFHLIGPVTASLGYGFLFSPPVLGSYPGTVDVPLLLAEWLLVGIVGAILWALYRDPQANALSNLAAKIDGNPAVRQAIRSALDKMKDQ